jgi:hypothetical protein
MNLDPRLEQIVALFLSTTFDGERANSRQLGERLAQRSGMTFDEAVAVYDANGRSIYDVFTLWRATEDDRERQVLRREAEVKATRAGQSFKDAFQADSDLRDHYNPDDRHEARQQGYKAAKAREIAAALAPLLERYGSTEAIIAPCERERKLLDAVKQWRWVSASGRPRHRWTHSVDGWADLTDPPSHVEAAIRNAYPLPETFAEAWDELRYWKRRGDEISTALGERIGRDRLDLVAQRRREIVESLLKKELTARTPADVLERFRFYLSLETQDDKQESRIFDDLEAIVAETAQPQASVHGGHIPPSVHRGQIADALGADPSRTDRSIAREFGCSPTTVGRVRADLGLKDALRSVQRGGQMFSGRYGKSEGVAA